MLPIDYNTTGECIAVDAFFEPSTLEIRDLLYSTASGYIAVIADTCDLTGAIDNMLQEGAEQLQKGMRAVNAFITEALNAIERILDSLIPDHLYDEFENLISGVISGLQSAISAAANILNDIKNVIKNVVDGVKTVLCDVASTAVNNVSPTFTAGVIALATIKDLKIPAGADPATVTDAVAKASGVYNIFNSADVLKNSLNFQILQINSIGSSLCRTNFRPVDNNKILTQYV